MRISSFNINKFCGAYSCQGRYYNPRNIDFKTSIKEIMDSLLKNKDDIIFVQEFINNKYIDIGKLFPDEKYAIFYNGKKLLESNVVAITLKNSLWEQIEEAGKMELSNKIIEMRLKIYDLNIVSFHNTDKLIEEKINNYLEKEEKQIILGDFNDCAVPERMPFCWPPPRMRGCTFALLLMYRNPTPFGPWIVCELTDRRWIFHFFG